MHGSLRNKIAGLVSCVDVLVAAFMLAVHMFMYHDLVQDSSYFLVLVTGVQAGIAALLRVACTGTTIVRRPAGSY